MSLDLRELASELDDLRERRDDEEKSDPLDDDDRERLAALESLEHDLGGDLHIAANHGVTLIEDHEFKRHAMDLASDLGCKLDGWPYTSIDWDSAADDLKHDYACIEFDGDTYYAQDI